MNGIVLRNRLSQFTHRIQQAHTPNSSITYAHQLITLCCRRRRRRSSVCPRIKTAHLSLSKCVCRCVFGAHIDDDDCRSKYGGHAARDMAQPKLSLRICLCMCACVHKCVFSRCVMCDVRARFERYVYALSDQHCVVVVPAIYVN